MDKYDKLFKDIKDYKIKFNINPSYEFLKEIISNIDLTKLDNNDLGFLLIHYYYQHKIIGSDNYHELDFDPKVVNRVLDHLKSTVVNERLESFDEYKDDFSYIGGHGFLDEMESYSPPYDEEIKLFDFQSYILHLNFKKEDNWWKIGSYLFVIFEDVAFEIFSVENTEIRILKNFNPEKINSLSINLGHDIVERYKEYLKNFGA